MSKLNETAIERVLARRQVPKERWKFFLKGTYADDAQLERSIENVLHPHIVDLREAGTPARAPAPRRAYYLDEEVILRELAESRLPQAAKEMVFERNYRTVRELQLAIAQVAEIAKGAGLDQIDTRYGVSTRGHAVTESAALDSIDRKYGVGR